MNPQPTQDGSVELEAIAQNGLQTNDILSNIDASNEAAAVKLHELAQGQEAQIIQAQDHTEKVSKPLEEISANTKEMVDSTKGLVDVIKPVAESASKMTAFLEQMKGDKGDKGDTGEQGKEGKPGDKGEKGDAGKDGKDGKDGANGIDGKNGKDGKRGERGEKGEQGKDGKDGKDGTSVDETKVVEQITTTLTDQLNTEMDSVKKYVQTQGSKTYSVSELENMASATTGQVPTKQSDGTWLPQTPTGGSGGGHTIQDEGSNLTQRTKLNFVGAGVTVTDDAGNDATLVTITSGGTGDVVGPASAVADHVATFNGTTGKLIKDSGLTLSGSNTGDQTSIVGITGTKAQFNTAVTDGDILYVGDITQYTDEQAQDAVGAMVATSIVYNDAGATLQRAALTGAITASQDSNATALGSFTKAQLDTAVSDGNVLYVGDVTTNATHTGEVTGSGALTVDKTAITNKTTVTAVGTDYILISDTSDSGNLKKALASDLTGGGGGSPGGSDTQIQFNDAGAFGGDADFTWDKTTNQLTLGSEDTISYIKGKDATTLFSTGNKVEISGGQGANSGNGGYLSLYGGNADPGSDGSGGDMIANGGAAGLNGDGGLFTFQGGDGGSVSGDGGIVTIKGGQANTAGLGGDVNITGGKGGTASGKGGDLYLTGGQGRLNADGGTIYLQGGAGNGTGVNGKIAIGNLSGFNALISSDLLTTANRSFAFPDNSGTLALLSDITGGTGIVRTVVVTSGSATAGSTAATDYVYFISGAHTMSLPAAGSNTNRYTFKNNHSAAVTVDTVGAETIDGTASISINPQNSVDIISDGTNYYII
jgi:hypothetical protein